MMHKKERRERLKQKYGDKTQLRKRRCTSRHVAETENDHEAGDGGTHATFLETRKHLLFFFTIQGGMEETAVASACVCVCEYAK